MMTKCEQLKSEYLNEITALMDAWKDKSARLEQEGSTDEAILERIRVNIGDIFYKMFNVSYNKACRNTETAQVELKRLSDAYLDFFEKIPAPWKEKMAKDKEHNMMEEYYKEQIKLETVEQIKKLFVQYYDRYNGES